MSKVKGQCSGPHSTQFINLIKSLKFWCYLFAQMHWATQLKLIFFNRLHSYFIQPRIPKSRLCCWDNPLGSINFTLTTFNNIKVLASYVQTTVWAISVTNCENATFWPICIMQEMWPIGSGQCMGNPSGNSQEVLGILHWIPVSLQRGLFNHPSSYITLHSV